ncbi:hypothetical protein [Stutzerimonas stutzeri]|uniref:Uncharacterized protein n=1 Tax=Stutzerimonas stutzeri KOS6 TaxID=1218352 RepID=A0A061JMH7_STUST|nr:hypothetical protein [Stutzerimonas stutzeri]EWC39575.1 hypothetical protein B597_019485 [Stutzerimonas stutzeri KOS6]
MTSSIGTRRIHDNGICCPTTCDICLKPRNNGSHRSCAKVRQRIYAAPAQQRLAVLALQKQGFRPQAITGAGIGLSRGNDHRVVCADGSTQRGVGAKR